MVSKDSAAGYARDRAGTHAGRVHALADLLDAGDQAGAENLAASLRAVDGPFGHLDARAV
jgi:1,4-alpha-glucan branching enzyme